MNKAKMYTYRILIGLLLALNIAAIAALVYIIGENRSVVKELNEAEENKTTQSAEKDDEQVSGDSSSEAPLIAIVDYDTKDAKRIKNRAAQGGCVTERVGSIEELDVDKYDAIIIPGGNSVTPSMYGAEKDPTTTDTDIVKDEFQFEAVRMYVDAGKPVLGICRGEQLVNNVMGGTTIQDMEEGWHKRDREIVIAEGTWLYDLMGKNPITYHYHHQCVDKLGEGLYATQWDPEMGHIEAYEHKTLPIYGIQWHPDSMGEDGAKVFAAYNEVVKENMRSLKQ